MIIGIAGGSGSGKTTFTNAIKEMFKEDILIIQMHWKRVCWLNM